MPRRDANHTRYERVMSVIVDLMLLRKRVCFMKMIRSLSARILLLASPGYRLIRRITPCYTSHCRHTPPTYAASNMPAPEFAVTLFTLFIATPLASAYYRYCRRHINERILIIIAARLLPRYVAEGHTIVDEPCRNH